MVIDSQEILKIDPSKLRDEPFVNRLVGRIVAPENEEHRDEALAELAERLMAEGALDLATSTASRMADGSGDKAGILARLGVMWARLQRMDSTELCFAQAERSADACQPEWQAAEALLGVARGLAETGFRDRALALLEVARRRAVAGEGSTSRQDSLDASGVLGEIAMELVLQADQRLGLATARAIRNRGKRSAWVHRLKQLLRSQERAPTGRFPSEPD